MRRNNIPKIHEPVVNNLEQAIKNVFEDVEVKEYEQSK